VPNRSRPTRDSRIRSKPRSGYPVGNGLETFIDVRPWIMAIRPIVRYPDPRLALPAQPVTVFDAALRVVVLDPVNGARTYVNPEIVRASPETILHQEGSVSMPGVNDEIKRHARIRIDYRDIHGNPQTEESDGLRAVRHQHEIDQLYGLQRLSRLKRERLIKRFEKASRGEGQVDA
jgi:peptide deformylase